jgi:dienelactone hydrolase
MDHLVSLVLTLLLFASSSTAQTSAVERVTDLKSADGTGLKGTYFSAGKPGPGVLLLHQCNQQRRIWDTLARRLSANGLNVLTFDLRNFGDSEGKPYDSLTPEERQAAQAKWPEDIDAAFRYLVSQPDVNREVVGVGGASCGVDNAVQTALRHSEVKSLVLLAGSTDLKGREFLRRSPGVPALFGYADDDQYPTSVKTIQWLYSLDRNPGKRLVRFPDGRHGAEIFAVHPEFEKHITDWYVTTLITTPGRAPAAAPVAIAPEIEVLSVIDEPAGVAKVSRMLQEARRNDPKAELFSESLVNYIGYEHLQAGDIKGAIAILKLNAEAFPHSANTYDSLADAYVAAGQKDLARQNARRALELLASDPSISDQARRDGIRRSAEEKLKLLGDVKHN